jgi:hypothetical protein
MTLENGRIGHVTRIAGLVLGRDGLLSDGVDATHGGGDDLVLARLVWLVVIVIILSRSILHQMNKANRMIGNSGCSLPEKDAVMIGQGSGPDGPLNGLVPVGVIVNAEFQESERSQQIWIGRFRALNSNATGGVAVVCPLLLLLETGRESSVSGEAGVGRTGSLRAVMIIIGGGHDGFYGLGVEGVSAPPPQ